MALVKTEPGREALQRRDPTLKPRERQILVIADGMRTRGQLVELLGASAGDHIDRLVQMGFLMLRAEAVTEAAAVPAKVCNPDARRSLVATKMYCIDMLRLLREPDAMAVIEAIQSSGSEAELMDNVFAGMRHVREKTTPSYTSKVAARLAEIIPQPYLAGLSEWTGEVVVDAA